MSLYRRRIFPALAGCLWLLFLVLDLARRGDTTPIKFAAICLCLLTALTGLETADGKLVALALCFTVGADWFLLVRNDHYLLGVGLFLVVQLLYAIRLHHLRGGRPCRWGIRLRLLALGLSLAAALLIHAPSLSAPSVFLPLCYFSNLCINMAEAFTLPRDPQAHRFAWGLLLFAGCDLCVGGWNLGLLKPFTRVGMWLFYLPSQVLIVLSQSEKGDPAP